MQDNRRDYINLITKAGYMIVPHRFLIFLIAIFAFYAGTRETSNKMSPKILLDIDSDGKRIEVKVGDEIQIDLKGGNDVWD